MIGRSVSISDVKSKMNVIIQFSKEEELRALPILLRHSPGTVLRDRTYIISKEAAQQLRREGVKFDEVTRTPEEICLQGAESGERI